MPVGKRSAEPIGAAHAFEVVVTRWYTVTIPATYRRYDDEATLEDVATAAALDDLSPAFLEGEGIEVVTVDEEVDCDERDMGE